MVNLDPFNFISTFPTENELPNRNCNSALNACNWILGLGHVEQRSFHNISSHVAVATFRVSEFWGYLEKRAYMDLTVGGWREVNT